MDVFRAALTRGLCGALFAVPIGDHAGVVELDHPDARADLFRDLRERHARRSRVPALRGNGCGESRVRPRNRVSAPRNRPVGRPLLAANDRFRPGWPRKGTFMVGVEAAGERHYVLFMWEPADYILAGRYCDTESLREQLERIRAVSKARAAVLLVYRRRTLFQSLLLVAHEDPGTAAEVEANVAAQPLGEVPSGADPYKGLERSRRVKQRVAELCAQRPLRAAKSVLAGDVRAVGRPAEDAAGHSAGTTVLLVDRERWGALGRRLLAQLHVMVNATSPTVVHRSVDPDRDLDVVLSAIQRAAKPSEPYPQILLDAALKLTAEQPRQHLSGHA